MGSIFGLSGWLELTNAASAFAKRGRPSAAPQGGPQTLSREHWPPAIIPDHVGLSAGYLCISDEFGHLAIVDLRRPGNPKTPVRVIGELSGLGRKVVGFAVAGNRAFALAAQTNDPQDPQLTLLTISLSPLDTPSVVSRLPLSQYTETSAIAASLDTVCVAGISTSGENLITVYQAGKGRAFDPQQLANFSVPMPVTALDLQDRNLVVLQNSQNTPVSQIDYVNMAFPRSPQTKQTIKLDGEFRQLARFHAALLVAGRPAGGDGRLSSLSEARYVILEPLPHAVSHITLDPLTTVLGAAAQKDRFMVVGDSKQGRGVISLLVDRAGTLTREAEVSLPQPKGSYGLRANVVLGNRSAYVASGWAGVQMLNFTREGWTPGYSYSIPRLPASSVASWGNLVVLGSSDLKLYDITDLHKPNLIATQELPTAVKAITGAGSFVLCLSKEGLALRKMDKLSETAALLKAAGNQLCYDTVTQKAFVLQEQEKKTVCHRIKVYSNSLVIEKSFDLPKGITRAYAQGGYLLAASLNDIYLYGTTDSNEQLGTRHFENLAVRDLVLCDDNILATFVDQQGKGFFLVLAKDQKDLRVNGSVDLPHDGVAVAAQGTRAVTVGKSSDGRDLLAIVDFKTPSAPRVITSRPVVESASAIAIRDRVAIVVGRGLEILSLS
ncbi:MAG TPA: hypothetical protein V6D17_17620 [Candidatus Obscuribacterales bacterium]